MASKLSKPVTEVREVTIQGLTLRAIIRHGSKDEYPLLVCNGLGANLEFLDPLVDSLEPLSVVRCDAPGSGGSSTPKLPYRLSYLAKILAELIAELGYEKVDVMGISWGGAVAQEFALNHPKQCRRLILAATTMGTISVPGNPWSLSLLASPLRWLSKRFMFASAATMYGGDFRKRKRETLKITPNIKPPSLLGYYWQLLAITGWTSAHRLRGLTQPTLLLAGEDDPLIPLVNMKMMRRLIPDARLVTFDCGHLFTLTRAREVADEILEFTAAE